MNSFLKMAHCMDDSPSDGIVNQLIREAPPCQHDFNEELICEFVHPTMVRNPGILVNFINHNCPDSATIIGGIRLKTTDIAHLPALIAKHNQTVKIQAAHALQRHLARCHSALGATENVGVDDFSLSFMLASLSPRGLALHPNGRNEGPMHYCIFPGLVDPVTLVFDDNGDPINTYVVNAYIHLLDGSRRRKNVIKKHEEDQKKIAYANAEAKLKALDASKATQAEKPSAAKKPRTQNNQMQNRRPPQAAFAQPELKQMQSQLSTLVKEVKQLNLPGPSYPSLPELKPIPWPPVDHQPEMPDDM